jgi:hypothetical protein
MPTANLTAAEVRDVLIGLLPPGAADLYDLASPGSNVSLLFDAMADTFKVGSDLADTVRVELFPGTATTAGKLPDWERALGLVTTPTTLTGTQAQRQAQVVARLREYGSGTLQDIRGAVEPLLGYQGADVGTLQIIECDRATMRTDHTYPLSNITIGASSTSTGTVFVRDTANVGQASAAFYFTLTHANIENLTFSLLAPDSTAVVWTLGSGSVTGQAYVLRSPGFAGVPIYGTWTVAIVNSGAPTGTAATVGVFVEGIGRDASGYDAQGGALFQWGVFADALKNRNPSYVAAQAALDRIKPAHTNARVIFGPAAISPDLDGKVGAIPGTLSAQPGNCIPHSNP